MDVLKSPSVEALYFKGRERHFPGDNFLIVKVIFARNQETKKTKLRPLIVPDGAAMMKNQPQQAAFA
jgi:hypothetical protein